MIRTLQIAAVAASLTCGSSQPSFAGNFFSKTKPVDDGQVDILKGKAVEYLAASSSELANIVYYGSVDYVVTLSAYLGRSVFFADTNIEISDDISSQSYSVYTRTDLSKLPRLGDGYTNGIRTERKSKFAYHTATATSQAKGKKMMYARALKLCQDSGFDLPGEKGFKTVKFKSPYLIDVTSNNPSSATYFEEQERLLPHVTPAGCCTQETWSADWTSIHNLAFKHLYCVKTR